MYKFIELWKLHHPGLNVYVLGDQLGSHLNIDLIKHAMDNGVYMWFFVSNTSHFIQPLDSTPNAQFKRLVRSYCGDAVFESLLVEADLRCSLFAAIYKDERDSLTNKVIKDGFHKTGIYPWDTHKIRENARTNIRGMIDSEVDEEHKTATEAMTTVLNMYLDKAKERSSKVTSRSGWIGKNGLFDPQQLVEYTLRSKRKRRKRKKRRRKKERWRGKTRRDREKKPRSIKLRHAGSKSVTSRGA